MVNEGKRGVVKDTFKTVSAALDAQRTMEEYTQMQQDNEYHAKKEAEEEEAKKQANEEVSKLEKELEEVKKEQQQQKSQDKPAAGTEGSSTGDSQLKEGQEVEGSVSKSETKEPAKHTAEELAEMEKYLMGKVLAAAWNGSKFEIQGTVRAVCDNILEDKDVSLETRVARAKALRLIGDVLFL